LYDINDIMKVLPHRYPMLLVEKILELEPNVRAVGLKNVSNNDPYLIGHFPNDPIFPGVLMIEAMAQVAGFLSLVSLNKEGTIAFFSSVDKAKFRKIVRPGDTLIMEAKVSKIKLPFCKMDCTAKVEDKLVCEAELMFYLPK